VSVLITNIREEREKAGMKQSELADLVHVRRETIVHLENGKYNPSLKLAMDIAGVFNMTVEELFEFQGAADPVPELPVKGGVKYKMRISPELNPEA